MSAALYPLEDSLSVALRKKGRGTVANGLVDCFATTTGMQYERYELDDSSFWTLRGGEIGTPSERYDEVLIGLISD